MSTHTFTVQKAYCTPAKSIILQALNTYGVPVLAYKENTAAAKMNGDPRLATLARAGTGTMPMAQEATVTVPKQQAVWAEYLMMRTGKLSVVGGRINSKNVEWAARHDGAMPRPWIEPECDGGEADSFPQRPFAMPRRNRQRKQNNSIINLLKRWW